MICREVISTVIIRENSLFSSRDTGKNPVEKEKTYETVKSSNLIYSELIRMYHYWFTDRNKVSLRDTGDFNKYIDRHLQSMT